MQEQSVHVIFSRLLSRAEAFGRRIAEAKDIDAVDLIEFLETMKARFRESFP
jgi:hypothetical protein